jgi:hypothetical protein
LDGGLSIDHRQGVPDEGTGRIRKKRICLHYSKRPQEIQEILFLRITKLIELVHDGIGLRRLELRISRALVRLDRLDQVLGPPVMEKKEALSQAP